MHRRLSHRFTVWLAPLVGAVAVAAFPAAAGAVTPTPTPCATPVVGNSPCYSTTAPPVVTPSNELANPPEGRTLTVPVTQVPNAPSYTWPPGTWSPAPLTADAPSFYYQWQDCDAATGMICNDIPGAISRTYTVAATDVGNRLQLIIRATNSAGTGYWVWESTGAAVQAAPIDRVAPSVSGPTQVGQTVTANPGTWAGTQPITYGYQWRHCDANGKNCSPYLFPATPSSSPNYVLQQSDLGYTMSVVVTATNSVGQTQQGSYASSVVTPAIPPPSPQGGSNNNNGANNNNNNTGNNNGGQTGGQSGNHGNSAGGSHVNIEALLMGALAPHGQGARIRALLKHGRYSFSFAAPWAGQFVVTWSKLTHGKRVIIAIATVVFHKAGNATINLVLTGKGHKLLKGKRKFKLMASDGFTPTGKATISASRSITLKR